MSSKFPTYYVLHRPRPRAHCELLYLLPLLAPSIRRRLAAPHFGRHGRSLRSPAPTYLGHNLSRPHVRSQALRRALGSLLCARACAPAPTKAAFSAYCQCCRCLLQLRCGYLPLLLCRRCCSPSACCSCTAVLLGHCLMLRLLLLCLPLPLVAAAVCC